MIVWAWIFAILELLCVPITAYCFLYSETKKILSLAMIALNSLALSYWLTYLILYYLHY